MVKQVWIMTKSNTEDFRTELLSFHRAYKQPVCKQLMDLTEHNEVCKVLHSVESEESLHLSVCKVGALQTGGIKECSCLVGHLLNTYQAQRATQGGKPEGEGGSCMVKEGYWKETVRHG